MWYIYNDYKSPIPEIRNFFTLTAGMIFFWSAKIVLGGHAAYDLTNRRFHANLPVKDLLDYDYSTVYIVPSQYGVTPELFLGKPILEEYENKLKLIP